MSSGMKNSLITSRTLASSEENAKTTFQEKVREPGLRPLTGVTSPIPDCLHLAVIRNAKILLVILSS
jgi:hypothetical protein